jgi:hypothetical protein
VKKLSFLVLRCALIGTAAMLLQPANAQDTNSSSLLVEPQEELPISPITVGDAYHKVHIMPPPSANTFATADPGPLLYHGGRVMQPFVTTYVLFWVPSHLQNGAPTSMSSHYQGIQLSMLFDYPAHGINNILTQYSQNIGGNITYIQNKGALGSHYYTDSSPFPASACTDAHTPGNCLTDAQIRAEVRKLLGFAGLSGGLNQMFLVYTPIGEGSCFDSTSRSCAYSQYCAYHSYFLNGTTPIIYSNEPYGDPRFCQIPNVPSPNNDAAADTAATAANHELNEAISDPQLNAWYTSQGNENGDLCAYKYGSLTWDAGKANQMWNGRFYLLQTEYNNHTRSCVQVGP